MAMNQSDQRSTLQISGLKTHFYTKRGVVPAVDGIDLEIGKGQVVGLVGESGCGKSITALSIMQLVANPGKVAEGSILLGGDDLLKKSKREMLNIKGNHVSMIFQEPMTSLNPVTTVGKQVKEAIVLHKKVPDAEARRMVVDIFRQVGISEPEKRYKSYPHQLSGGIRQRVMIGMAMVCQPDLMIADEPTTALDVTIEAQILRLMREMQQKLGTAILMITHNLGIVAELCDTVYIMYAGKIMEQADVFEIFANPRHPYTFGLLHSIPKVAEVKDRLFTIRGMVPNLLELPKGCRFCPRCDKAMNICAMKEPALFDTGNGHKVRCHLFDKEVMGHV